MSALPKDTKDYEGSSPKAKASVRALLIENLLTGEELAADCGRSIHAVYQWVKEGCPNEKYFGRLYFDPPKVAEWHRRRRKR